MVSLHQERISVDQDTMPTDSGNIYATPILQYELPSTAISEGQYLHPLARAAPSDTDCVVSLAFPLAFT